MAGIVDSFLVQDAVYWAPKPADDSGRVWTYEDPQPLKCRWSDHQEVVIRPGGDEQLSKTKVLTSIDVAIDGVLFLGTMEEVIDFDNPLANPGAGAIISFKKTPEIDAKEFVRKAML